MTGRVQAEVTPPRSEPMYSSDRVVNWIGWLVVLGPTIAVGLTSTVVHWPAPPPLIATLATVTCTMGAFVVAEPALRGWLSELRVRRLLRRAGIEAVHDVFVSASDGRRAQLDHVAFLGQTVVVIETKSIEGIVGRRDGRWWRLLDGRERAFSGRTPQQQVINAREVLMAAYPPWGRGVLGFVAVGLGSLGEGLEGDPWVVVTNHLALTLGRSRQMPDDAALRRWRDLSRFLMANRRTGKDRLRSWREVAFDPKVSAGSNSWGLAWRQAAACPWCLAWPTTRWSGCSSTVRPC